MIKGQGVHKDEDIYMAENSDKAEEVVKAEDVYA